MEIRAATIISLCLAASAFAEDAGFRAIRQFPLDDRTVYEIKISRREPTTIMFPSAIEGLDVADVTADPAVPAPVYLHYTKERYYFTVRALRDQAEGRVNVIWHRKTYVLRLETDAHPFNAVTFYPPDDPDTASVTKGDSGPGQTLALLDRAKAYHLLQEQYPEAVAQIDVATAHRRMLYKGFDVEIDEVFRFDPEDTLVFKLLFVNRTDREICYAPQTLAIRVGSNVYFSRLSDASGIMPPGTPDPKTGKIEPTVSLGYFAVVGSPDGGRNNLPVGSPFNVIVTRVEPPDMLRAGPPPALRPESFDK